MNTIFYQIRRNPNYLNNTDLFMQKKQEIRNQGRITLLSVGEYVYQNKSYYKFITVEAVIEPVYTAGMITSLRLRIVDYQESIKGGTSLWGNVSW